MPDLAYRPERGPVAREIVLNPKDLAQNTLLIDGLERGTDCEVAIGEFTIRIEPAGSAYRLSGHREMGRIKPGQAFRLTQTKEGQLSERLLCSIENTEGRLYIEDEGSEADMRVRFPYDVTFELGHAGVIRSPEDPDVLDELYLQLQELADRDLSSYSDHAFARETYKERILETVIEDPVVIADPLFERFEQAEVELEALSPDERRHAFRKAFKAVREHCENEPGC